MEEAKIKSLFKAIKLLDYFTVETPERGISELSELSGMYKSVVHNFVTTFEKCGFLEKNPVNNRYRLGIKILELNNNLYMSNDLRNVVRPHMERIGNQTNESVYFAIPTEDELIYLDTFYPGGMLSARSIIGKKAPLYCTGVGKAILAYQNEEFIQIVIQKGLHAFTQNTLTDAEMLIKELKDIGRRGFAIDNMEHEYGIKCVAVPIKNIRDSIVGSISISGPSLRFTDEKIAEYASLLMNVSNGLKGQIQR